MGSSEFQRRRCASSRSLGTALGGRYGCNGFPQRLVCIKSDYDIVLDGTFDYRPYSFNEDNEIAQLYSLHAFCNKESVTTVVALLNNKNTSTYKRLFQILKDAIIRTFGNDDGFRNARFHFDFEMAAIKALKEVIPVSQIFGCLFHLANNIRKRIQELGLGPVYNLTDPYDEVQYGCFRKWVRQLIGLSALPPDLVLWCWTQMTVPRTPDPHINQLVDNFALYFKSWWLKSQDFINLWNHWNNPENSIRNRGAYEDSAKFEAQRELLQGIFGGLGIWIMAQTIFAQFLNVTDYKDVVSG